jgi:hypothetical protein
MRGTTDETYVNEPKDDDNDYTTNFCTRYKVKPFFFLLLLLLTVSSRVSISPIFVVVDVFPRAAGLLLDDNEGQSALVVGLFAYPARHERRRSTGKKRCGDTHDDAK